MSKKTEQLVSVLWQLMVVRWRRIAWAERTGVVLESASRDQGFAHVGVLKTAEGRNWPKDGQDDDVGESKRASAGALMQEGIMRRISTSQ